MKNTMILLCPQSVSHLGIKLNQSIKPINNTMTPKCGEEGYDPENKYDLLISTIIHSINIITERASLDQFIG